MERYSGDAATLTLWHGTGFPRSTWRAETGRDGGDVRRGAHNPEVAGSNPAPATKARGPFSNREGAFCMWFVHGFVHGARSSNTVK
jgi:hypothetical protein